MDYKIIPIGIIQNIKAFFYKSGSMNERYIGIQDGIRTGMKNFLTGTGNTSWRYIKIATQTYDYSCTDVHCYPVVVFIENGISGLIVVALAIILILKSTIDYLKKKNISVDFIIILASISAILLHSLLDFDLSINMMKILFVMILALYVNEIKPKNIKFKLINVVGAILLIIFTINIFFVLFKYNDLIKQFDSNIALREIGKISSDDYEEKIKKINYYIQYEQYKYRDNLLEEYERCLESALKDSSNLEKNKEFIQDYYDYITLKTNRWNFSQEIKRLRKIKDFSKLLNEEYKKTGEEFYNEIEIMIEKEYLKQYNEVEADIVSISKTDLKNDTYLNKLKNIN